VWHIDENETFSTSRVAFGHFGLAFFGWLFDWLSDPNLILDWLVSAHGF
jgi:hypothetical protein